MIREFLRDCPGVLDDLERLLDRNRIFVDRIKGVGVLTKEEAINRSCSGPVARASGVTRDLRKDEPYLAYARFRFPGLCARRAIACPLPGPHGRDGGEPQDRPPGHREPARRAGQRGPDQRAILPPQRRRSYDDRGSDFALRAGDDQPRLRGAQRGSLRGHRGAQRRAGVLPRRRRQPQRPIAPAAGRRRSSILPCFRT